MLTFKLNNKLTNIILTICYLRTHSTTHNRNHEVIEKMNSNFKNDNNETKNSFRLMLAFWIDVH